MRHRILVFALGASLFAVGAMILSLLGCLWASPRDGDLQLEFFPAGNPTIITGIGLQRASGVMYIEARPMANIATAVSSRPESDFLPWIRSYGEWLDLVISAPFDRTDTPTRKILARGWPWLLAWCEIQRDEGGTVSVLGGLQLTDQPAGANSEFDGVLPLRPIWTHVCWHFAAATAIYALLTTLFYGFRGIWRRATGRCTNCGYALTGCQSMRCPECGSVRRQFRS